MNEQVRNDGVNTFALHHLHWRGSGADLSGVLKRLSTEWVGVTLVQKTGNSGVDETNRSLSQKLLWYWEG